MQADIYNQILTNVAATLAASLQPKDVEDAVQKYQKVLAELDKRGGPLSRGD